MSFDLRLLLAGLVLCGTAGACLSDVEYLRAGNKDNSGGKGGTKSEGGTFGGFITGGTFGNAGTDKGGTTGNTNAGGEGGDMGGSGGVSGMTTGGGGMAGTGGTVEGCNNLKIVELFDFSDSMYVANTSTGATFLKWVKGPYDSTDTNTGKVDATAQPPNNPKNLANLSILDVNMNDGNPAPAMRYTIPFNPLATTPEAVNILFIFAAYGKPADAVDFSRAMLKASVLLKSAPNTNCMVTINAWTTGTDAGTGQQFNHVDGLPKVPLTLGKWTNVQMDLSKSNPPNYVNQYGFVLHSSCSAIDMGTAGAGGAPEIPMGPTVVEFDNITTVCK